MPRVLLNKQAHMPQYFTEWLIIQMRRTNETQEDIGKLLDVTKQAVSTKMRKNQYSFQDFIAIINHFGASEDELVKLTKI